MTSDITKYIIIEDGSVVQCTRNMIALSNGTGKADVNSIVMYIMYLKQWIVWSKMMEKNMLERGTNLEDVNQSIADQTMAKTRFTRDYNISMIGLLEILNNYPRFAFSGASRDELVSYHEFIMSYLNDNAEKAQFFAQDMSKGYLEGLVLVGDLPENTDVADLSKNLANLFTVDQDFLKELKESPLFAPDKNEKQKPKKIRLKKGKQGANTDSDIQSAMTEEDTAELLNIAGANSGSMRSAVMMSEDQ